MSKFKPKELPDIKRGEYFSFLFQMLDDDKNPIDLAITDFASQIRNKSGDLIATCSIVKIETGKFKFYVEDTNDWPIGTLEMDIDVKYNNAPFSTTTFLINVVKDITRPVS
jgi:hypothetical protein